MRNFKNILELSKKIASAILNKVDVEPKDLLNYFNEEDSKEILNNLVDDAKLKDHRLLRKKVEKTKRKSWETIEGKTKTKVYYLNIVTKVAAVFIGVLSVSYYYLRDTVVPGDINLKDTTEDVIVLKMANGITKVINTNEPVVQNVVNAKGKKVGVQTANSIVYDKSSIAEELVYNELIVPNGKKFKVYLSDGTHVNLNSGSSLRYPISFINGSPRKVFLKGEGLFEVTKDEKHPFIVNVDDMNVKVLGTTFNISAYKEDATISTVLVEGSVQVFDEKQPGNISLLAPGYKAAWSRENQKVLMEKVDVSTYISWVEGKMVFRGITFQNMLKKLERSYNVSITNQNENLNDEIFSATFHSEIETVEQVLNYISKTHALDYSITGDKIIIN